MSRTKRDKFKALTKKSHRRGQQRQAERRRREQQRWDAARRANREARSPST